jgi:hypothetical protein
MTDGDRPLGQYVGGNYRIASLQPDEEPSVVLSARYLRELAPILKAAYTRVLSLTPGQNVDAMRSLCEELRPLLKHHEQATREWLASRPLSGDAAEVQKQLDEVRRMLDEWR